MAPPSSRPRWNAPLLAGVSAVLVTSLLPWGALMDGRRMAEVARALVTLAGFAYGPLVVAGVILAWGELAQGRPRQAWRRVLVPVVVGVLCVTPVLVVRFVLRDVDFGD
jgi:hypothetical protein